MLNKTPETVNGTHQPQNDTVRFSCGIYSAFFRIHDPTSPQKREKKQLSTLLNFASLFVSYSILQLTYRLTASLDINSHESMPMLSVGMRLPSRAQCLVTLSLKSFCSTMSKVGVVGAKRFRVYEVEGEFICSEISRFLIPPLLPSAHKG